jgi:hypothetical protein
MPKPDPAAMAGKPSEKQKISEVLRASAKASPLADWMVSPAGFEPATY